jgi:hypothetical protein
MYISENIIVKAIKTDKNELIPLWDERLTFQTSEDCGDYVRLKNDYKKYFDFIEVVYSLKDKSLSLGIEIEIYPEIKHLEFKIGQEVYFEKTHRKIIKSKIKDIIYEDFDLTIKKGKNLDNYYTQKFKNMDIKTNDIYCIKNWKPTYLLDTDDKVDYDYKLYHILEN